MAQGVNKVILIGNVGRDPEVRYTQSGTAVANFSIATNERWTDRNGERQEHTEWHRLVAWGKLADIVHQYVKKGELLYVEGNIRTRQWEDRDGNTRYTTEIRIQEMQMLGGRRDAAGTEPAMDEEPAGTPVSDDDIPF